MSTQGCPEHADLVALIRDGAVDEDARAHIDGCEECHEVVRVVRGLAPLAAPSHAVPPVADVYWHARAQEILRASDNRIRRVVRPLQFFSIGVGAALIAAALVIATGPLVGLFGFGELVVTGPLSALMAAVGAHVVLSGSGNPKGRST